MRKLSGMVSIAVLAVFAACSEATSPESSFDPALSFAKGGVPSDNGGGKGSPHFTSETTCTFNSANGNLDCSYQIAGLGANSSGLGTLVANIGLTYSCDLPSFLPVINVSTVRVDVDFYFNADKKGNAKGTVSAAPAVGPVCIGTLVGSPVYSLNSQSSTAALPWPGSATGTWALFGLQNTAKGGTSYIYFNGSWVPAA